MTTDLKRRVAALEGRRSLVKPVGEMSDVELLAVVGLGDNPTDEQLRYVLVPGRGAELNQKEQTE